MPAGELGTIATGLYTEAVTRLADPDLRAGGVYVDVLARVTPAAFGVTGAYVDVLTEPPSGLTGWTWAMFHPTVTWAALQGAQVRLPTTRKRTP